MTLSAAPKLRTWTVMTQLKRSLGFAALLFYSVGVIIGAGIYSVVGAAASDAGDSLWLSFVLGAVIALFTGLSYAELSTMYPEAGAEYVYLREAMPRHVWLRFLTGAILTLAAAATAATVALAFGGYMREWLSLPTWLIALVLLTLCTGLNIIGIKESSTVNILFTTIEVLGLIAVIYWGFTFGDPIKNMSFELHPGVMTGASLIFFVYLGFEEVASLAEEAHEPARHLPKAIYWSLAITTVLYVLVGLAVVSLMPPQQLAASSAPLADAVRSISPKGANVLSAVALFSTANTALITLIGASRMLFSMGRDREAPSALARVTTRKSPYVGAISVFAISALLLFFGEVAITAGISSFGSMIAFAAVNLTLILLARQKPDLERPYRAPLRIGGWPVTAILGLLSISVLILQFERITYLTAAAVVVVGLGVFWLYRRFGRKHSATPN
jgi:basic amino acid/polyamine antiporter, APA family